MRGWRALGRGLASPALPALLLSLAVLGALLAASPLGGRLRAHPYFSIGQLVINGQGPRLDAREIRDWIGIDHETSLWDASPNAMVARLRAHPLVAWADVRREFPDRLEIRLREREPAAIVLLDELFYVDRAGALFGPVSPSDSVDYPVITGIDEESPPGYRRWALRRALRLLRLCDRSRGLLGGISEVHVDHQEGAVLYPASPRVPIVLGWGSLREKIDRARRVLDRWGEEARRLARIDTRFLGQVVVELREEREAAGSRAPARRRPAAARERRV